MLIKEERNHHKYRKRKKPQTLRVLQLLKRTTILSIYSMYHIKAYLLPFPMRTTRQQTGRSRLREHSVPLPGPFPPRGTLPWPIWSTF